MDDSYNDSAFASVIDSQDYVEQDKSKPEIKQKSESSDNEFTAHAIAKPPQKQPSDDGWGTPALSIKAEEKQEEPK